MCVIVFAWSQENNIWESVLSIPGESWRLPQAVRPGDTVLLPAKAPCKPYVLFLSGSLVICISAQRVNKIHSVPQHRKEALL